MLYDIVKTHVSAIRAGDTVLIRGIMKTVCGKDLTRSNFMGHALFGDTYNLGQKPVLKVRFKLQKQV